MSGQVRGAFHQVMRPGTAPSPLGVGTPATTSVSNSAQAVPPAVRAFTDYVGEFIESCRSAIDVAFARNPEECEVAPGVATVTPLPLLLAYLLYLASTAPDAEVDEAFDGWFDHVDHSTWERLGFAQRPPRLSVALAFELMGAREHQAPELHGLIALVEFLAGAGLLHGVRS